MSCAVGQVRHFARSELRQGLGRHRPHFGPCRIVPAHEGIEAAVDHRQPVPQVLTTTIPKGEVGEVGGQARVVGWAIILIERDAADRDGEGAVRLDPSVGQAGAWKGRAEDGPRWRGPRDRLQHDLSEEPLFEECLASEAGFPAHGHCGCSGLSNTHPRPTDTQGNRPSALPVAGAAPDSARKGTDRLPS